MRDRKHTFVFLLCHDAPEEMDKRFSYRRHFSIKILLFGMQARQPHAGLLVSCINSTADTKLSFPYTDTRKFLKASQVIS